MQVPLWLSLLAGLLTASHGLTPSTPLVRRSSPKRLLPLFGGAAIDGAPAERSSTCRHCKKPFYASSNDDSACSYHPGIYTGRLNRVNDVDTSGLEYFWSCCGEYAKDSAGCVRQRHFSYDDDSSGWRSPLTGKVLD